VEAYVRRGMRVLAVSVATVAVLWLSSLVLRQETVTAPLQNDLLVPGVSSARYTPPGAGGPSGGVLTLRLANGVDLAAVVSEAEARVRAVTGSDPAVVVSGPGQAELTPLAERLLPAAVQAMATGQYLAMAQRVTAMARAHGAAARLEVGRGGQVDLTVSRHGDAYYAVLAPADYLARRGGSEDG
jgi:hypothetical protein